MNKLTAALFAVTLPFLIPPPTASAGDGFAGSLYGSVNSMYLWRGLDLSPDSDFVVQPGLDLSYNGFSAGIWANYDEDSSTINETDVSLEYSFDIDAVSLAIGNISYLMDEAEDTNELYLGATFNILLSPSLTIFYDWDQSSETGIFLTAAVSHSLELMDGLDLNLDGLLSFNIENYSVSEEYSNFHNAELSASIDWLVTDALTITPAITFSMPLTDDAEDYAGIVDETMAGLTINFDF